MATNQTRPMWSELIGSNNWEGLLDPLNLDLRKLILHSGDFIQATYDAFNNDQNSKYCGSSAAGSPRSSKRSCSRIPPIRKSLSFFTPPHMSASQKPLSFTPSRVSLRTASPTGSATSPSPPIRSPEPQAVVKSTMWRGTTSNYEWIDVFGLAPVSAKSLLSAETIKEISSSDDNDNDEDENEEMSKVMSGWLTIYPLDNPKSPFTKTSVRMQVLKKVNNCSSFTKMKTPV